jgi:hypothetical protein
MIVCGLLRAWIFQREGRSYNLLIRLRPPGIQGGSVSFVCVVLVVLRRGGQAPKMHFEAIPKQSKETTSSRAHGGGARQLIELIVNFKTAPLALYEGLQGL